MNIQMKCQKDLKKKEEPVETTAINPKENDE
jgi:hypothetical protein